MSQKGKQPQQQKGQQQQQPKSTQPTKQTLETLVGSLLDQGFEVLAKNDVPAPDKKGKAVTALCTLLRTKLKSPKNHADLPKDAISFTLQLQLNSGLSGPNSKKVMIHIFTFMIEELANWEEYGIDRNDVHQDYIIAPTTEEEFQITDISPEEFHSWQSAFNFLRQGLQQ